MRKTKKAIASLAIAGMVLSMAPLSVFGATTTNRLGGAGRVETAIQIAAQGWTASDSVIVVPADDANVVDALAAAPLAGQLNAPILVTYKGALDPQVQAEIVKLGAKNVYAVGALSADTVASLKAISGVTVTALQGADRTETAAKVAAQLTGVKGSFVVAYDGKADALSAASFAAANDYSIVIANPDGTIPAVEKVVAPVYTVGGQVSYAGATALAGVDRYATNDAVVDGLDFDFDTVYVANGQSLVDALAGAPLAAKTNSPIVLGDAVDVATGANDNLTSSSKVIALGGTGAVSDSVLAKVAYEAPATLAVESVSAINGIQLKVTFNNTVDSDAAQNEANYKIFDEDGGVITPLLNAYELQDDDKTVIITLPDSAAVANDDTVVYVVTVKDVEAKDDSTKVLPTYSTTVSVNDVTNPAVSAVSSKTNTDIAKSVKVTFSEPIRNGVIKIDGTSYGSAATIMADDAIDGETTSLDVTVPDLDLDATVSHTLEVVNLEDYAGNILADYSKTFSITKDEAAPTIVSLTAKSDSQAEITFNKSMAVATVDENNISVVTESGQSIAAGDYTVAQKGSSKTVFVLTVTDDTLYSTKSSRTLTVYFDEGVQDSVGNSIAADTSKSITLTKDTVKPTLSTLTYTTVSSNITKLTATFSENVQSPVTPTVIDEDGQDVTTGFFGTITADSNKVTYELTTPADLTGTWTFVFGGSAVKDMAVTPNGNSQVIKTIDFASGTAGKEDLVPAQIFVTSELSASGLYQNVIKVVYPEAVKGGTATGSATTGANYTLDGMSLASAIVTLNSDVETVNSTDYPAKTVATIKVPAGTISSSNAVASFTIRNVQTSSDTAYNTYYTTVDVTDDTRATLKSAEVVADTLFLTFSEAVDGSAINALLPADSVTNLLGSLQITNGTKILAATDFDDVTVATVAGNDKMIQVSLTPSALTRWDSAKTTVVKTLSSTGNLIADVAGNTLKADVTVTATK